MVHKTVLFDEIDTTTISLPHVSEIVAISHCGFLIVCCYRQPSANDLTLFQQLDQLLDSNVSGSPVICGDFNVHEASWLHSSHTSAAGTAALEFCECRGFYQLVDFPTRQDAILDLILSEHTGTTIQLPNLNTSDHVTIFLSLATSSHLPVIIPPPRRVFHWSHAPWRSLSRHFNSIKWNFQGIIDDITTRFANIIYSTTIKFVPSCVPQNSRPTPWWNRSCEAVRQRKISSWKRNDIAGFNQISLDANFVYEQAIQDYRAKIRKDLRQHSTSKRWWSLTKSLIGSTSGGRPMLPPAHQLAEYFSTKLSLPNNVASVPTLKDCHQSLFTHFRFKVSHVKHILCSLDTTKSVGDDNVSLRVLKSCASALCGPLFALFQKICNTAIFPSSWKISRITAVHKKGTRSDPTNYRPITVLPTLSRVFEQLLITQLQHRILPFIPSDQFGFLKEDPVLPMLESHLPLLLINERRLG